MSLSEKLASLMARPGQDLVAKDDVPWWLRYSGRGLGTVGSLIAIILGVLMCTGIMFAQVGCLLGGLFQMVSGFIVIVCEAPCCCMFIDFVQTLSDFMDKRPYWNKSVLYMGLAIPPIIMCFGASSFIGSGLIFCTGIIYGMMALGRKGSQSDMAAMAGGSTPLGGSVGAGGSTVGADHNVTLMEDPDVWRPN